MPKAREMLKKASKRTEGHEFYNSLPKGYVPGKTKYIVITGSVISGVGKGTFSSCLGNMLRVFGGFNVVPLKFECYVNYDSGTLNPYRHGEVFVLDDGTETDLDLGTYERMLGRNLSRSSFVTMGRVFKTIIDKERAGKYLGRDVEFIPHVTGEIKGFARRLAVESGADIVLIEIGGTVGELQNSLYLEAMRELAYEEGKENVCFINVTYVLEPGSLGEQKSKAAQLGIKTLMSVGIQPDIIVCRSENPISEKIKEKISIYSNVPVERTIGFHDTRNIYRFPTFLKESGLDRIVMDILKMKGRTELSEEARKWKELAERVEKPEREITIGITGKYTTVHDSYMSILKALEHTAPHLRAKVNIRWIDTTGVDDDNVKEAMKGLDGVIVPGGFGSRGTEGKISCIRYARENNLPYLGLCYGFQMAVIEFARNVCGLKGANSTEIDDKAKNPVICILPEQEEIDGLGGTMRLGGFDMAIKEGTLAHRLYGETKVRERFRHRYNVSTDCIETLESKGMVFSGMAPEKRIMQILEIPGKRFFFATQYHGEFTSRPLNPNPVFKGFVKAAIEYSEEKPNS
jgi:CTP synthase